MLPGDGCTGTLREHLMLVVHTMVFAVSIGTALGHSRRVPIPISAAADHSMNQS